jgi:hypothetical protein
MNLVRMHEAWGPKASTPNALLSVKESARSGQVMKFRLFAEGVPKDAVYSLVTWPVTQKGPSEILRGVTLSSSGLAICAGTPGTCGSARNPDDPIDVDSRPIPGEPTRLGLVSADGKTRVFARFVPLPLRGEDRGCRVEAILLTPRGELVVIEASGLPANSTVTLDSDSAGERHSGKEKADADGSFVSAILPSKQGVTGGILKVDLKSAQCSPSVSIPWGQQK